MSLPCWTTQKQSIRIISKIILDSTAWKLGSPDLGNQGFRVRMGTKWISQKPSIQATQLPLSVSQVPTTTLSLIISLKLTLPFLSKAPQKRFWKKLTHIFFSSSPNLEVTSSEKLSQPDPNPGGPPWLNSLLPCAPTDWGPICPTRPLTMAGTVLHPSLHPSAWEYLAHSRCSINVHQTGNTECMNKSIVR